MTDTTEALAQGSGGEALPPASEATQKAPVPKNDAEAELLAKAAEENNGEPENGETSEPGEKQQEDQQKKRNRTTEYIRRLQEENRRFREELESIRQRLPPEPKLEPPKPEDFYTDPAGYAQRVAEYTAHQERERLRQELEQKAQQEHEQRVWTEYQTRAQAFAASKPDFEEVVSGIRFPLPPEVQAAIAAHESGPEIAYHLGLNDQDAFLLSLARPEMAQQALEVIVSRMKAAQAGESPAPSAPAANPAATTKPISQAPAPPPRVGGRAPTEVPPEKMTDDEWYRREKERRRKR